MARVSLPHCGGRLDYRCPCATLHFRDTKSSLRPIDGEIRSDGGVANGSPVRDGRDAAPAPVPCPTNDAVDVSDLRGDSTGLGSGNVSCGGGAPLPREGEMGCGPSPVPEDHPQQNMQARPVRNPDTPLRESELAPDLFVEAGGRVRSRKLHDSLSGVRGVGGRIHGDVDHFSNATIGVQLAPTIVDPVIYANVPGNVEAAIHERVDKKQKQPKLSKEDKQMFGSVTSAAMGKSGPKEAHIFTKEAVQRVMGLFAVTDLKSKKWSEERFNQRLKELYAEAYPTFKFTTKIKLEPMGTDAQGQPKPPRFLIADGDPGQIMASDKRVWENL